MPSPFPHLPLEQRGTLTCAAFESQCLANNPWGDPYIRDLWIYRPPGYRHGDQLPAIVFLAGFGGTGEGLLARSLSDVSMASRLDHLIASGESPPVIGIFPDCMSTLIGTQFMTPWHWRVWYSFWSRLAQYIKREVCFGGRLGIAGRSVAGMVL